MSYRFFPFDSGEGGTVTEQDWSSLFRNYFKDGIIPSFYNGNSPELHEGKRYLFRSGGDFAVIPTTNPSLQVYVRSGIALIKGHYFESTDYRTFTITPPSSGSRKDRIYIRLDWVANTIGIFRREGTASAPPSLQQNSSVWDIPLATITVNSTDTAILSSQIEDEREIGFPVLVPPVCVVTRNGDYSIPPATRQIVYWNLRHIDSEGCHSASTDSHRIYARQSGLYLAFFNVNVNNASTGNCTVRMLQNRSGTDVVVARDSVLSFPDSLEQLTGIALINMRKGDYIFLHVENIKSSSGNLTFDTTSDGDLPTFGMIKVGEMSGIQP